MISRSTFTDTGFTLLEVLIALAVIAVALTSLFASQSYSLLLASEARFNMTAAFLSREIITNYEAGITDFTDAEGTFGDDFPGFSWQTEVTEQDLGDLDIEEITDSTLYKVDVVISFQEDAYTMQTSWVGRDQSNR